MLRHARSMLRHARSVRGAAAAAALSAAIFTSARAAEERPLVAMTSGAFTAAFAELTPMFERASGRKVTAVFGGSMGAAPDAIPNRLRRGEPADVVIMAASALDELIARGAVVPGSRVDLVRSTIGMAVRAGAAKPDIHSVDALKAALLAAKSIAYSSSASGVYLSTELFPRLGIERQIAAKVKRIESEPVGAVVARGEAEIGFQQISELRPVKGIEIVGPLPDGAQRVTVFSAGVSATATAPDAARQLIAFLSSPAAAGPITKSGLEPISQAQPQASGTVIGADEIAKTLQQSIANNVVDQPVKAADIPGGHKASLALLRRTKAETSALIHDRVTEIYQITEGSGTIVTGGTLENATATDLTRLNAGPSRTGTHRGGDARHVGPKDVIIIPAGTAHRFSQLDGAAIVYLVYRFEPK